MDSMSTVRVLVAMALVAVTGALIYLIKQLKVRKSRKECYLKLEEKPQNRFKRVRADNSYDPFNHLKRGGKFTDDSAIGHPYEEEIKYLLEHPHTPPGYAASKYHSDACGSHVWVNTLSRLKELACLLSKQQVFAVDTEQHSLRSFLGFTALMQVSTEEEDYLVDTIALHDQMQILCPVFSNSSICKVFHGADNDVLWLQRDFHIYVVNLFDTAKACSVLCKPQKSLAYLLDMYCGIATNKSLQCGDWRQRPLPSEMVEYACTDVHYLLYIAGCLTAELRAKNTEDLKCSHAEFSLLHEASRRSNTLCLQLYVKGMNAFPGNSTVASVFSRCSSNSQGGSISCSSKILVLVRKICAWRDLMARVHDESPQYVLSDRAVMALAEEAPETPEEIYSVIKGADSTSDFSNAEFSSIHSPSPVVCCHVKDLNFLLQEAKDNLLDVLQTILKEYLGPGGTCPLSTYNCSLLSKYISALVIGPLKQTGGKLSKHITQRASRELFVQKFSCKSPVYHNCRIYANDGRLLCYCDRRKLEWYLSRGLAELIDNEPPAIMLLFEPKGYPEDEDNDFYIQSKRNMCVGCGEENHYLRYRIIPSCYRMHFPEHLKSHRSHDIVLLCVVCHEIAHSAAEKYKRQVAKEFGIPLFMRRVAVVEDDKDTAENGHGVCHTGTMVSPIQLRTAALALLRHGSKMPLARQEELREVIRKYFGGGDITNNDIERALIVSMTPHERRRFEKKKGLSLKNGFANVSSTSHKGQDTIKCMTQCISEDRGNDISCSAFGCDLEPAMAAHSKNPAITKESFIKARSFVENHAGISSSSSTSHNIKKLEDSSAIVESGYANKLSLLGHGPHGKQVVARVLEVGGEEEIQRFCQTWRQVFVEAIHPRFLPAGWDINHSGRRDFGEYSVYNPAKRSAIMGTK